MGKIDMDFIVALGHALSLLVLVIFTEGVIAMRQNAKWTGLILPFILLGIAVALIFVEKVYFGYMMIPVVLSFATYFFSRNLVEKREHKAEKAKQEP